MSSGKPSITSEKELKAELKALLVGAEENGVDVEGGFECRNGPEHPDWDIIITEVEKNEQGE